MREKATSKPEPAPEKQPERPGTTPARQQTPPGGGHEIGRRIGATDVELAYWLLLGRRAESLEVVERHLAAASTLAELRQRFLNAPEFYRNSERVLMSHIVNAAYRLPPPEVEDVSQEDARRLFAHVQESWTKLGEQQPHYSVFSHTKFLPESFVEHQSEFEDSGRAEVEGLWNRLADLSLTVSPESRVVELGCGVGRVTRFLCSRFAHVTGLDISKSHLELARRHLSENGAINCDLIHLDSLDSFTVPAHDLFYSRIVLQHNPPPVIVHVLRRCLAALRPEGVAYFQLLTAKRGYRFDLSDYLAGEGRSDGQELHALPQRLVFRVLHENDCVPLDVSRDASLPGFDRISTVFVAQRRA